MVRLSILIAKSAIKTIEKMYGTQIIIAAFMIVELATVVIVLWETFTGKNLVDVIWDLLGLND